MSENGVGRGSIVTGRYRLEDLLEDTGGARFWRATDLTLARNVAVHVLSADDPRAAAALNAARTSALVSDSHILRVLDAVEQEDTVFLVHEWGTGVSLDQLLAEEVLDARRAAWLVREVAQGIVAGHAMGVAHGRLIPENVMISEAGSVKLIGFVVNRVLHGRPEPLGDDSPPLSEHESDVLNLGALLYACLVGRWPGTPASALPAAPREHDHPIRPRRVKAGVPKFLDSLCQDILAGPRAESRSSARYESAAAVAEALSRYLGDGEGALPVVNAFTQLDGPEAFVDPARAPAPDTEGTLGSVDGDDEGAEVTSTTHAPAAHTDPEATQAAMAMDDSAPGRAVLRSQLSDSSAEASAQVDTEERQAYADDDDRSREKSRAARAAIGRRSEHSHQVSEPEQVLAGAGAGVASAAGGVAEPAGSAGATDAGKSASETTSRPQVAWGPDAHTTGSHTPVRAAPERPGTLWLRLAALVALLVVIVVGVMLAFDLGSTRKAVDLVPDDDESSTTPRQTEPVEISEVSAFDPPAQGGNGEENSEDTSTTVDGDPRTTWRTETYFDGPALAPYKQGVGLQVDLGDEREVRQVDLDLVGQGYDVTVFAAEPGAGAPTDIAGLPRIGRERGTLEEVSITSEGTTTRYLVVWFRSLPQVSGGYAGEVAEIVVRS